MTYIQGSLVSANHIPDHNTISDSINEVYNDSNQGSIARISVSFSKVNDPGIGYAFNDVVTVSTGTGTSATCNVTSISTIYAQTEADFVASFNPGSAFASGNDITLTDGTTIHVDLTAGGNVTEFTITGASLYGTASQNPTILMASTTGVGTGFSITLANANQKVSTTEVATGGNYTVAPTLVDVATTGGTGTGLTLDLTLGGADFGYGQTLQSSNVSVGNVITASQWTAIFDSVHRSANHQSSTSTGIVPTSVSPGDVIASFDAGTGLLAVLDSVRNNRLTVNPANMTTTSLGTKLKSTRPTTTTWTNVLIHEFTVTFPSYDRARYFFNTSGEIHMSAERAVGNGSGDATQNSNWDILLAQVGTVAFSRENTTNDGTQGTGSSIGFYDLTGTYQQLYIHNGSYGTDSYKVEASMTGGLGTSGVINFKITFTSDAAVETIGGILDSNIDEKRASGPIVITSPIFATVVGLPAGS